MSVRSLLKIGARPEVINKHFGPGPHPGTGTPQTIHAPGGGINVEAANKHLRSKHAEVLEHFGGPEQLVFEAGVSPPFWSWLVRDVQKPLYEDGNEDFRAQWEDKVDALMQDLHQLEEENERDILVRLAKGEITADEAITLGGMYEGQQELRFLDELPDTVYHVTTDTSAVVESGGLKARDELGQRSGVGLGGGTDNTISFTADPEIAEGILFSMRERHAVLNDPATEIPRLIEEAKAGHNADKPWWGGLETKWTSDSLSNGGVDGLIKGEALYFSSDAATVEELRAQWAESRVDYWRVKYDLDSIELDTPKQGLGTKAIFRVKFTDAGHAEAVGDFMDEYSLFRQSAGGPLDPLFIMNDDLAFKNLDPDDFSIIKGRTTEGAQGYQLSSLGEWRTWTGEVLEDFEVIK